MMAGIPKISISVPVYNAEKYLRQCLDSLVGQTIQEIEIILVNDGSTDGSESICREYAENDSRIKLICKENGGLATARQTALEASCGQFFCVCDADDWYEPNMCEKLYNKAIETCADVVFCDYVSEYGIGVNRNTCYGKDVPDSRHQIASDVMNGLFPCNIWSKMIKREVFSNYNLSWQAGINMGEDFLITLKLLQCPVKIVYLPECLYHYRRMPGEDSYTNRVTIDSYNQMLRIQEWMECNYDRNSYKKGLNHYLINIAFAGLRVDSGMTSDYYRQTSVSRLSTSDLFKEHSLKSFVILLTKLLGYRAGVLVFKLMYKFVYK